MKKNRNGNEIAPRQPSLFVRPEKNLVAIGFFSASGKNKKNGETKSLEIKRYDEGVEKHVHVEIATLANLKLPTTADQDKYMAFLQIVEKQRQRDGAVKNPIKFTSYELIKIQGKDPTAGKNYKDIEKWLKLMKSTVITSEGAIFFANSKRWMSDTFSVFDRVQTKGQHLRDGGVAEKNYVWLSQWQLDNINNFYQISTDYNTYKTLKSSTAKLLINYLELCLNATKHVGKFEKRYDALCEFLGIKIYKYLSKAKEKLAPSLDELIDVEILKDWKITKTKNNDGLKVIFFHGSKFSPRKKIGNGSKNKELVERLMTEFKISLSKADYLVENFEDRVQIQLDAIGFRKNVKNKTAFLIKAIEEDFTLPGDYYRWLDQKDRNSKESDISKCSICDKYGMRLIEADDPDGTFRYCTHDPKTEANFREFLVKRFSHTT